MKSLKKFAVLILIILATVCAVIALPACDHSERDKDTNGNWDEQNGVRLGMVSDDDCPWGKINDNMVKTDLNMQIGKKYYLIIDFTIQAAEDNDGRGNLEVAIGITPAATIDLTIQEAPSGSFTESTTDDTKEISLNFSIPDLAETIRDRRIVLRLKPIAGSEQLINVEFKANKPLNNNLTDNMISKTITSNYTQGLKYTEMSDGGYSVTQTVSYTAANIIVPYFKDGRYITEIGDRAFAKLQGIDSITIPDKVRRIGSKAFYDCSVHQVIIPNSLLSIGNEAFKVGMPPHYILSLCFKGTREESWNIKMGNDLFNNATKKWYYYSETKPEMILPYWGYWHYVDGKVSIWQN